MLEPAGYGRHDVALAVPLPHQASTGDGVGGLGLGLFLLRGTVGVVLGRDAFQFGLGLVRQPAVGQLLDAVGQSPNHVLALVRRRVRAVEAAPPVLERLVGHARQFRNLL